MAIKKEYKATHEQREVISYFSECVSQKEDIGIPVEAPAGTGKTQLTLELMKELSISMPEVRLGYFIFNNFMKDEINKRAYAMDILNAQFFTYHSFLLQHALKNEKIKSFFYDKDDNPLIDFAKQGYSKQEARKTLNFILGTPPKDFMIDGFLQIFNRYLGTDISVLEYAKSTVEEIYNQETKKDTPRAITNLFDKVKEIETDILDGQSKILGRMKEQSPMQASKLMVLFIIQSIRHMIKSNKLSHSAYYREVYDIALKHNIDLFEDFDAIIVDEAQDMDKIFKMLIERAKKPVMIIGDRGQGIYEWRGAVNMMESASKKHEPFGLSYSFRYTNDVAQLSNILLQNKESKPVIDITGRYTPNISMIKENQITNSQMVEEITNFIERRVVMCENHFSENIEKMKKRERGKFLAKEKVAFISRNNAELIDRLFKIVPALKNTSQAEYISISLTDSVSEDFVKIRKLDFGSFLNKKIEEAVGIPYNQYKVGKTLRDMVEDYRVQSILLDSKKFSFLGKKDNLPHFEYILEQLSSRKTDSISKSDNSSNIVFTTAHGSKGKEYSKVFLGADLLQADKDGLLSDEEYNIANVAITRTKGELFFMESMNNKEHFLHSFFLESKDLIQDLLKNKYTYTMSSGLTLSTEKPYGELFQYTIIEPEGDVHLFMQDEVLNGLMIGEIKYSDNKERVMQYYSKDDKKFVYLNLDGERIFMDSEKLQKYTFSYGTGKTSSIDNTILNFKKKVPSELEQKKASENSIMP